MVPHLFVFLLIWAILWWEGCNFFFAVLYQLVLYIVQVIPESNVLSHVSPLPLSHCHLLGAPWSPQLLLHSFCQKRLQTGSLWLTCTLQVCLFWP